MFDFVIGAGQGGSRIAQAFSKEFETDAAYFNLTSIDFSKMDIPTKRAFVLEEGGTGRDPKTGEKKVKARFSEVREFLSGILAFDKAEYVLICVGGGGGSGTGFLFPLVEWLAHRKNVLVIFTIPEKREGVPSKPNAYISFDRLLRTYCTKESEKKISLLPVDNSFAIERYGRGDSAYWGDVNQGLVVAFRRFHNLTTLEKGKNYMDMASGYKALDKNDLRSILFAKGGLLDIREMTFETMDEESLAKRVKSSSMVFGSLDIKTAKRYLVAVGIPEEWRETKGVSDFVEKLFDTVSQQSRHTPYVIRSSYYNNRIKRLRVHLLMNGLTESHSMQKIKKGIIRDIERLNSKEDTAGLDTSGLEDFL